MVYKGSKRVMSASCPVNDMIDEYKQEIKASKCRTYSRIVH